MNRLLWTYRVVRSVLFTAVILVAFLYVASYILLSMPTVQRRICRGAPSLSASVWIHGA